ncbi:MAG: DNRLRE domain-containing protein, partial [Chloroflexi bacterium]|nr:DNRLRE domain-containing protein [Chloroflexota bacterium]
MNTKISGVILLVVVGLLVFVSVGRQFSLPALADLSGPPHLQPASPSSVQTRVFRQGLASYTGVRDTWISAAAWDTPPQHTVNYGQNQMLLVSRDGGDNPLLRFDVSAIPSHSAVISATLSLSNTTRSSISGSQDFARRVLLYAVLRDWDEGNQTASPINASAKRGATGDQAFDYFPGEGTDVPWTSRGMAVGTDYAAQSTSYADVVNAGWYTWDVTALVRAWVRGEQANYGIVLRDATGYADDHDDTRAFVSSQATGDPTQRPTLTVVYNPDVPFADAGPDQSNLTWDGGAVTLDGSQSHDRPGGDDASLTFSWRIVQAAYGSGLSGNLATGSAQPTLLFTPDAAGEWEIELTVANNVGESATDRVHLRLLRIGIGHPRIFLTPAKLAALRARAVASNPRWTQLKNEADAADGDMLAKALVSQVLGNAVYCTNAIGTALARIASAVDWPVKAGDIALIYDWCYGQLSAGQRTVFIDYFNAWGDATPKNEDVPGWGNYWPRYGYSYGLMGLATFGDNARAQEWLDEYRYRRYRDIDLPLLDRIAAGGGWPEGMIYDWIANNPRVKGLEAWRTATSENLFLSTDWYRERLGYFLLHRWPGVAEQFGYAYHPYVSTGDTERSRGSIANYGRIMGLILIERFPADPLARQLQAYLAASPTGNSMRFLAHDEFLWFDPVQPSQPPDLRTHYAAGTGAIFMRSGWPSGAADTNPDATYLTFQSGDHFSYHQHFDQNSFTLFKGGDLALDSGVYSGEGLSNHDINYYVRTIAHNTLVVYNPNEDFSTARPDATANDGGQRSMSPGSRSPQGTDDWDLRATQYDTGDMLRFEDAAQYTYALGDATKAYNNPSYNQAMDTGFSGNTAKVSRFQRELVYLRPGATVDARGQSQAAGEYVVIFDRVGVTQAAFSGANTKLLFHTLAEPAVNGAPTTITPGETLYAGADLATVTSGDGKLFIKSLLPAARNLRKVGGRGVKSFWVFDANYDWHWATDEAQPRPINDFEEIPYGEWRLELEPADTALAHNFLTVLHPAGASVTSMPATTIVTGTGLIGAHIADPGQQRVVL